MLLSIFVCCLSVFVYGLCEKINNIAAHSDNSLYSMDVNILISERQVNFISVKLNLLLVSESCSFGF